MYIINLSLSGLFGTEFSQNIEHLTTKKLPNIGRIL